MAKKSTRKPVKKAKAPAGKAPRPAKPIALYYWPTPNGHKISIMLEELGVPYEVRPVNIGKGEQFEPAFLKISPNNRMPAIIDPNGPGGRPISVFESGAILQYLGRKYERFYPQEERARVQVEEWLFWQVGGLGPMAGQANHFLNYAPEDLPYAKKRYSDEVHRLFGVMNTRLATKKFLAGVYSIADMACWSWVLSASKYVSLDEFPNLKAWRDRVGARPAVVRGKAVAAEARTPLTDEERKVLFGQRAR
ncbi:MAG TPA: glutathione S-transferase N-terminal domain-containing protein [Rhizomicrobium sp.]|jgi:GST-like protein